MMRVEKVVIALSVVALAGCQAGGSGGADDNVAAAASIPILPRLDFVQQPAEKVLQEITDSARPEVTFMACADVLPRKVTIQTAEGQRVAVVVAMLITQLGNAATFDGPQWTLYCREAAGPGKLFAKGQSPRDVTVPIDPGPGK